MKTCREVIPFTVGFMEDPGPLVDHVYQIFIAEMLKRDDIYVDMDLFQAIYRESRVQLPGTPLHNNNFNYYNHYLEDRRQRPRDTTPIYIPSRYYFFIAMKEDVQCNIPPIENNSDQPECRIDINNPDESVTHSLLTVCREISQHQRITYLHMSDVTCSDHVREDELFNLSENTRYVRVRDCKLPLDIINHMMQQLHKCKHLPKLIWDTYLGEAGRHLAQSIRSWGDNSPITEISLPGCGMQGDAGAELLQSLSACKQLIHLDLHDNNLTGCLSCFLSNSHPGLPQLQELNLRRTGLNKEDLQHLSNITQSNKLQKLQWLNLSGNILTGCLFCFLPDPHPGLPQLQKLELDRTRINKEDLQHIWSVAYKLPNLQELGLTENTLTGCLFCFLPDPHPGLPQLQKLNLWDTGLNKDDLQHLLSVAHKLPKLKELDLSNYTLTGCLFCFLPDPHPGLPQLEMLDLKYTGLNKDDVQHLLSIAHKLPKLKELNLAGYRLTGCFSYFLPDPHPGLPQLQQLNLLFTRLNRNDLQYLTHLIGKNKLPMLGELDLVFNNLCEMEAELEQLIEAGIAHHKTKLQLSLRENGLSQEFKRKWNQRCRGTNNP